MLIPVLTKNIVATVAALIAFKAASAALKFVGLMGRGGALSLIFIGYNTVGKAITGATRAAQGATGLQTALAGMKMTGMQTALPALRVIAAVVAALAAADAWKVVLQINGATEQRLCCKFF